MRVMKSILSSDVNPLEEKPVNQSTIATDFDTFFNRFASENENKNKCEMIPTPNDVKSDCSSIEISRQKEESDSFLTGLIQSLKSGDFEQTSIKTSCRGKKNYNEEFLDILSSLKHEVDSPNGISLENLDEEESTSCSWDDLAASSYENENEKRTLDPTDQLLLKFSVRELNEYLKTVPKDEHNKLKNRRRLLKNRSYAEKCRNKRILTHQLSIEENKILKRKLAMVTNERDRYKKNYDTVVTRIKQVKLEMQKPATQGKITFY